MFDFWNLVKSRFSLKDIIVVNFWKGSIELSSHEPIGLEYISHLHFLVLELQYLAFKLVVLYLYSGLSVLLRKTSRLRVTASTWLPNKHVLQIL